MPRGARTTGLAIAALLVACARTDAEPVDVDGDECPGGRPAFATMTILAELAAVPPARDPRIRVRGTRKNGESPCFADGGVQSFTVMLEGGSTVEVATPPLAHGAWDLSVAPLSGDERLARPRASHVLQPGVAHVLAVSAHAGGDLQLRITP